MRETEMLRRGLSIGAWPRHVRAALVGGVAAGAPYLPLAAALVVAELAGVGAPMAEWA